MKKMLISLLAIISALNFSLFAAEEKIISSAKGQLIPGDKAFQEVRKIVVNNGIYISVLDGSGKSLWQSDELGSEEKLFRVSDKSESLIITDINGDGAGEIVTAAFYGPRASGLFVFTFDPKSKKFAAIPAYHPKEDLTRDFLVSDILQEDGHDMVFQNDGTVRLMGLIYSEKAEDPPFEAYYYFKFVGGKFVFQKTEILPPDKG